MVNCINLTKLLSYSAYKLWFIGNLSVKLYSDWIDLGLKPLDLIYNNIIGFFIKNLYRAIYLVTFLYNVTKKSKVILLTKKSGVLPAFKKYYLYYKKRDKQV